MVAKLEVHRQRKPVEFDGFTTPIQLSVLVTFSTFNQNVKQVS